jgi:anti-sigma B factor antagonist
MPELTFDISSAGPSRVLMAVAGEVDMATAGQLVECLLTHADYDVVVDLAGVTFLDSSGVSALLEGYKKLRDAGHTLCTTGERDNVRTVLEVAGVVGILHMDGKI